MTREFDIEGLAMESGAHDKIIKARNKWSDFETWLRKSGRTTMLYRYQGKAVIWVLRE